MLCILPAGMSRSAWVALAVSSVWVLAIHYNWISKIRKYIKSHHYATLVGGFTVMCALGFVFISLFQLKSDSAYGRLFIWENTCKAIFHRPLLGYGAGSFPEIYGKMQADYFASGDYTGLEERIAGAPEYAFNEYLQLGVEGGIILLLLFVTLVFWGLRQGIRNKEYAASSGLLSLLLFSFSSYPFQLLSFLPLGVLLLAVCATAPNKNLSSLRHRIGVLLLMAVLLAGNIAGVYKLRNMRELSDRLYYIKVLQDHSSLKEAATGYGRLYDYFKHNFNFLMKYAGCLYAQKRYEEAIAILERAKLISCHPNIYNVQGQCYQASGNFVQAEECFKKSTHLLPIRIYPYYLLAKLYAEPSFFHETEMKEMANIVLSKKPKVNSKAIWEMRMEMNSLLTK